MSEDAGAKAEPVVAIRVYVIVLFYITLWRRTDRPCPVS